MIMDRDVELFEKYWEQFLIRVKGRMVSQAKKQELTYPLLKLLLKDISLSWDSDVEENGRWLRQYSEENPQKGEMIRQILLEDMEFSEVLSNDKSPAAVNYIVPAAGAAAGYCISSVLHAGAAAKAISTVAPALLLYPSAKAIGENAKNKNQRESMEAYLSQLEKYRKGALSVLQDSV